MIARSTVSFGLLMISAIQGNAQEPGTPASTPAGVRHVLEAAIEDHAFPGCVVEVGNASGVLYREALGHLTYAADAPAMQADTLFDLASLTKVVFATTVTMRLEERGLLDLNAPVSHYLPEFVAGDRAKVTLTHLLTHTSGLPAWLPLYRDHEGLAAYRKAIVEAELEAAPGERYRYSDLGIILLGCVLEKVSGESLGTLLQQEVVGPLGLTSTMFRPTAELAPRCAPTEDCQVRQRVLQGEVHDENTWKLGGVSTHAGVFSTAEDLGVLARMYLNDGRLGDRRFLKATTIAQFTSPAGVANGHRALGWQKPSRSASCGRYFSERSFGHTGFTGTSIWIDPEATVYVVLLTNRVHPTRENQKHVPLRRALHDAVRTALERR